MLNEDDYSSDTSDEDFVPEGHVSENDENLSDNEYLEEDDDEPSENKKRKGKGGKKPTKRKKLKINPLLASVTEAEDTEDKAPEVREYEEEKKADSLWEDFLADVDEKPAQHSKQKSKTSWGSLLNPKKKSNSDLNSTATTSKPNPIIENKKSLEFNPSTVTVTKVFEFAGEEVRVEEKVPSDSLEAKKAELHKNDACGNKKEDSKKPRGLSNVIGLLSDKKKRLSTLEKSKLDWMSFKSSEGLEEELQTHLKSKDGYLEKKEFLERADLRQFEIERNMRMSKRGNR